MFDKWFKEQFGKEPYAKTSILETYEQRDRTKDNLARVEGIIREKEQWLDRRNAALYAWNLKDKDKCSNTVNKFLRNLRE